MRKTKLKTTPWKGARRRAVKPADEPHIAREREVLEAELGLAAVRKRRKASQATVAKKLNVSQSTSPNSSVVRTRGSRQSRPTSTRSVASSRWPRCSTRRRSRSKPPDVRPLH